MALAVSIDRDLEVVRESTRVEPSKPFLTGVDAQVHEDRFRALEGRQVPKQDVEQLRSEWQKRSSEVAERALALAEQNEDSSAAWARSALAHLDSEQTERAVQQATFALDAADRSLSENGFADGPAVLAAARVLVQSGAVKGLAKRLEPWMHLPYISTLLAGLIAEEGDIPLAIEIAASNGSAHSKAFAGYLCVRIGELQRAVRLLRQSVSENERDVDAQFNLALALFRMGAKKKALRQVAIAGRLAPGRLDIEHLHLELLATFGGWDI